MNTPQGAEYMRKLALDAGFQQAKVIPTDGVPGVFATLDAGAKTTLGIYFMYDVKQFDPAEWSSPPLEGRLVDRAGRRQVIVGRGAVNQKGPEMAFLAALQAFKAGRAQAAGEPRAGGRGRGGNRLDPLPEGDRRPRGRGGAAASRRRVDAGAGQRGRPASLTGRQGRGRVPADLERRELGQVPPRTSTRA